jgi:hypothetical protein
MPRPSQAEASDHSIVAGDSACKTLRWPTHKPLARCATERQSIKAETAQNIRAIDPGERRDGGSVRSFCDQIDRLKSRFGHCSVLSCSPYYLMIPSIGLLYCNPKRFVKKIVSLLATTPPATTQPLTQAI